MTSNAKNMKIGVIGAGTMGTGIAQFAAQNGHVVVLVDVNQSAIDKAESGHKIIFDRLVEKGILTNEQVAESLSFINYTN
jgi:3-hydroxybutyryl-CoA dehydrogenase